MQEKPSESGIRIDNLLTMALQKKSLNRNRFQLVLLALLGSLSSIITLLSMFSPACNTPIVVLCTCAVLLFFCWHAGHIGGAHVSMAVFFLCYLAFFIWQREAAAAGVIHLLNDGYQTINLTDWYYFDPPEGFDPEYCTTLVLCLVLVPILWLLSYAVMRFQNFFLSLLITFPFVEIGFFFGIVPEHLPAFGMFAFWCGMGAVQIAGSGCYRKNGKAGFMRRRNTFSPVPDMKFLVTEYAGSLTAIAVVLLMVVCDLTLGAVQYKRPYKVRQLRSDFQHYAASIDWSDLSTLIPDILKNGPGSEADDKIDLGSNDRREFDEVTVSRVVFTDAPHGPVYLKFATYADYGRSSWSVLPENAYSDPVFQTAEAAGMYPPEYLYCTAGALESRTIGLTLEQPNEILAQCIPYGFAPNSRIPCKGDVTGHTQTDRYLIFGGWNYEYLFEQCSYTPMTVSDLISHCPPEQAAKLEPIARDRLTETVYVPQSDYMFELSGVLPDKQAEAEILSACGYGDFARAHYLDVPQSAAMDTIRSRYADLLDRFDAASATPAETILEMQLLRERLCAQVSYSLSPGKTPPSRDFAAYFLLENKKGYCTHYATAAVLLCRMAGIPARYCEGYVVDNVLSEHSGPDGSPYIYADILDSNAHAWCEVYLDGIGWMPFEFTYSYFTPPEFIHEQTTDPTESLTEPPTAPPPAETVTAPPTEAPSLAATGSTQPVPAPRTPGQEGSKLIHTIITVLLWAACIVLAVTVLCFCFVTARAAAIRRRKRAFSDPALAADAAWRFFLSLLRECGTDTDATTTAALAESAHAACGSHLPDDMLDAALEAGKKHRYSPHGASEQDYRAIIRAAVRLAASLYRSAKPLQKFRLKWIRHYL